MLTLIIDAVAHSGKDINVPIKTRVLGMFDFRHF